MSLLTEKKPTDWAFEIANMKAAKKLLRARDTEKLWRHEPPRQATTAGRVVAASQRLGWPIDAQYEEFLLHADGWPAFLQDIDLFGTCELLGDRFEEAADALAQLEPEVLTASNVNRGSCLPIGASSSGTDLFVMPQLAGRTTAPVIWIAGVEVERYYGFVDFFEGMRKHNINEADDLARENAK